MSAFDMMLTLTWNLLSGSATHPSLEFLLHVANHLLPDVPVVRVSLPEAFLLWMHPGQDGSQLFIFQTPLVLKITEKKNERRCSQDKSPFRFIIEILLFLRLPQFKDWTYRFDSHALQLYYKSLFNFWPNIFLDAAAVFLNSRVCCMLLLWRWLILDWLLLG